MNNFQKHLRFMDHPFMQLIYCFGFTTLAVHLFQGRLERFEAILLGILTSLFAVTAFLEAIITSIDRWWLEKSDG